MNTSKIHLQVQGFIFATFLVFPIGFAVLIWLADGAERATFGDAKIISVRYIMSVLLMMVSLIPFFHYAAKRAPGTPLKWGEAMIASTYIFFILFWLYGVVPHEFLTWADSELGWRSDRKVIGPEGSWATWWGGWARIPLTIHLEIFRDLVVTILYVIGLGGFIWGFAFWNDRQKNIDATPEPVSTYGRPLAAKAGG